MFDAEVVRKHLARVPGRCGKAQELAGTIAILCLGMTAFAPRRVLLVWVAVDVVLIAAWFFALIAQGSS